MPNPACSTSFDGCRQANETMDRPAVTRSGPKAWVMAELEAGTEVYFKAFIAKQTDTQLRLRFPGTPPRPLCPGQAFYTSSDILLSHLQRARRQGMRRCCSGSRGAAAGFGEGQTPRESGRRCTTGKEHGGPRRLPRLARPQAGQPRGEPL